MRPMVPVSITSTSSAQVDGQSCGQAEAAMRGRTSWFMTASIWWGGCV
jgi:hypothetical protein